MPGFIHFFFFLLSAYLQKMPELQKMLYLDPSVFVTGV